ncbi:flavin reductase family protein [Rhodococcus koreensis]|uniref:flavin reductase family protein n=1 Tax=Rhodococcus koreensis TaxID=99653 RepID=UPI00366DF273
MSDINQRLYRDTVGHFASGITVISGIDNEGEIGFTCQSFYSVSMEPPLVSFSVMTTSTTYPRIRATGRFSVNVLSCQQDSVASQFARKGTDKWAGIRYSRTASGNPVIEDTTMWLDCDIWAEHLAGDHHIVIGRVKGMSPPDWHIHEPLLFFRGAYCRLVRS